MRGEERAAGILMRPFEPDRVSGCAEQAARLRERNTCDPRELGYSLALRPWRQLLQQLLHARQAEDVVRAAAELGAAAGDDELHVPQVGLDVRGLQLAVEPVDEGLHLLRHARRDPAACDLVDEARRVQAALQVGEKTGRDGQRGDDPAGRQRTACLDGIHSDEMDVLPDLVDRVLDAKPVATHGHDLRQVILVDERNTRLRAAIAGDEADEARDEQRIRDQNAEEKRGAYEHTQVLPQDERRTPHVKISSAWSSRYSAVDPTNVRHPRCSTATRSA